MKLIKYLSIFFLSIIIISCARETFIPIKADFSIVVVNDDYSAPVKVEIINKSENADYFQWEFEGSLTPSSNAKNPSTIIYNKAGKYTITLKVSNRDNEEDTKSIEIEINDALKPSFKWEIIDDDTAPAVVQLIDESLGAANYHWEFQNATPATSSEKNPKITFIKGGKNTIKLTINNGKESSHIEKTIEIKEALNPDFDWEVDFIDSDFQAPLTLYLKNKSTSATSYQWNISGANPSHSTEENPKFYFSNPGTYSIVLKASNTKETKTLQKQITIYPDHNILSFNDIKLGISTAQATIGSFFSSQLGKVLKKNEINSENGAKIDFGFFGFDDDFSYNQIVSPQEAKNTGLSTIPNAIHTKIINSQELVGMQLTSTQFDAIQNGSAFSSINIYESNKGKTPFDKTLIPRIILFQTADGRKGALKIKGFVSAGKESYILTDIKIQKSYK